MNERYALVSEWMAVNDMEKKAWSATTVQHDGELNNSNSR